jgi:general secretion pathway protein G
MVFHTKSGSVVSYQKNGFTLIELMVVLAIIAMLITIAMPRYMNSVDRSKEAALHQDLVLMRDALDKYYGDHNRYPDQLQDLVSKHYLRAIPLDPITGSDTTWIRVAPDDIAKGGIYNIKSGAPGNASDGTLFVEW